MKLVIGASGFVGSHVTRQLVEGGEDVRVLLRKTSSTKGIDDLAARLLKRNLMFAAVGLRIATTMTPLDHSKAERELGWKPEPVEESIRRAAIFFTSQ